VVQMVLRSSCGCACAGDLVIFVTEGVCAKAGTFRRVESGSRDCVFVWNSGSDW
jgi:hypothetical protein